MKYVFILFIPLLFSCAESATQIAEKELDENKFTVERADEWTDLFFRKSGWFGGDGIFAMPFSGNDHQNEDSLIFVFSDTMIGEIKDNKLEPGFVMINNSIAQLNKKIADKNEIAFKMAKDGEKYVSTFIPKVKPENSDTYFWLGDGFVNHEKNMDLYQFAYKITNTNDKSDFPFKEIGNTLIRIPRNSVFPFQNQEQLDLPFNNYEDGSSTISFGAGLLDNSEAAGEVDGDGFLYIYGIKDIDKKLVSARVPSGEIEAFDQWQFWNGNEWSKDIQSIAALSDSVSNEMSVSRLAKGKYALVYQLGGIYPDIMMQVGPTPVGPFGPRIKLYDTRSDIQDADLFTYNAKAHPALSAEGELLISYNVNSFKFFDVVENKPNLYRPRFIKVKFHH